MLLPASVLTQEVFDICQDAVALDADGYFRIDYDGGGKVGMETVVLPDVV